jgi:hypothetical protein
VVSPCPIFDPISSGGMVAFDPLPQMVENNSAFEAIFNRMFGFKI